MVFFPSDILKIKRNMPYTFQKLQPWWSEETEKIFTLEKKLRKRLILLTDTKEEKDFSKQITVMALDMCM